MSPLLNRAIVTGLLISFPMFSSPKPAEAQPVKKAAPKLYALIIADTKSNLKESLEVDRDNMRRILEEGFSTRPNRLVLEVLDGNAATPDRAIKHLADLKTKVQPQDTVLLYYSGHGASDKKGQFLALTAGRLYRTDVAKMVSDTGARLGILLTDCCSKNIEPRARGDIFLPPPRATWPVMDFLFFNHSGLTDINGCQEDAFSWCYMDRDGKQRGGTFTLALVPLLCQKKAAFGDGTFTTWAQFAQQLQKDTNAAFLRAQKEYLAVDPENEIRRQKSQTPQLFTVGKKDEQAIIDKIWLLGVEHTTALKGKTPITILTKVYPKTPAADIGLTAGDVILSVDKQSISAPVDFDRALEHSEGKVTIEYEREKEKKQIEVQLRLVKPK